jgi:glucose-1-phosphate thymidylyltransferase
VKAYLLAAGYATRMYPLTRDRPKPLLEVAGRPILTHILDRVLQLDDLSEVVVIANDRFFDAFDDWARHVDAGVPVRVLNDGSRSDGDKRGAIGDLAFALAEAPVGDEDWLVAAGDNLLAFDLRVLQRAFRRHRVPLLAVRPVDREGSSKYNEVILDDDGRVLSFREKPAQARSPLVAIALYFLPAGAAALLPRYLAAGGNPDAPGHFIAWLVDEVEVRAEHLPGGWFDIGSLEGLAYAREHFVPGDRRGGRFG